MVCRSCELCLLRSSRFVLASFSTQLQPFFPEHEHCRKYQWWQNRAFHSDTSACRFTSHDVVTFTSTISEFHPSHDQSLHQTCLSFRLVNAPCRILCFNSNRLCRQPEQHDSPLQQNDPLIQFFAFTNTGLVAPRPYT